MTVVLGRRDFPPEELPGREWWSLVGGFELVIEMRDVVRDVVGVEMGWRFEEEEDEIVVVVDVMGVELRVLSTGGFRSRSRSRSRSRGVVRYWRWWLLLFMLEVRDRSRSRM